MSQNPPPGPFDPVLSILEGAELFRGLPPGDLRRLAELARRRRVAGGQVLIEAGDEVSTSFVVGTGSFVLEGADGGHEYGPGAIIMPEALAGVARALAQVTAREGSEVLVLSGAEVRSSGLGDAIVPRIPRPMSSRAAPSGLGGDASQAADEGAEPLAVSRRMQRAMVPRAAPTAAGYDVAAGTTAEHRGRGNTVWDCLHLHDGRPLLVMLDVREDGLPPAHLLGMTRAALWARAAATEGLASALADVNAALAAVLPQGTHQFVECALLALDGNGAEWAAAGRVPAGVLERAGALRELASHGPPLGMMEGFRYGTERVELSAGDALLVLSSASPGLFRGAADLVAQVMDRTAGDVVAAVHKGLRRAHGEGAQETSVLFVRKH